MLALPNPTQSRDVQHSLAFLEEVLRDIHPRTFAVRLWDGTIMPPATGQPARFTLVIRHPGALRRMFESPSELRLGEAYIYNDFDIEGDIELAARLGQWLAAQGLSMRDRLRLRSLLTALPDTSPPHDHREARLQGKVHSKVRDRSAIRYHYDVSNEFYALFLDRRMVYSTACFSRPEDDLDTAQLRKLENICRALQLQKSERFLDIGCGWGGLIIHAARNFGVEALGITLSEQQAELAQERIRMAGLQRCCRVEVRDYRDLEKAGAFDKIASVGMAEHVGAEQLQKYFAHIWELLRLGGTFFNSCISRPVNEPRHREDSFTEAYVFPDGELVPIHEVLASAETAGFEVRSTENMRNHYALTLRHWVHRLEDQADKARTITDDIFYRVWRLYMAGSAARFLTGKLHVYQTLLSKPKGGG